MKVLTVLSYTTCTCIKGAFAPTPISNLRMDQSNQSYGSDSNIVIPIACSVGGVHFKLKIGID